MNETYTISVSVSGGSARWGFQAVIVDKSDNTNAGTIFENSVLLQTQISGGRTYINHTFSGTSTNSWTFDWTAPNSDIGDIIIYVAGNVADGNSQNSGDRIFTHSLTRVAAPTNINPVISTSSLPDATEDSAYSATVSATDQDAGDVLSYSITSFNTPWLSINSSTGALSGTPANDNVGNNVSVTIKVTDDASPAGSDTQTITFNVINVNDPPVIATVSLADATESVAYGDTVKATDQDAGDSITFVKVSGPDWMTVGENGAVRGTPGVSDVGINIAVSISVEDADGAADTLNTSIAVIAKDVVVMADLDSTTNIAIPADGSSISLDFSNNSSLSIAFTSGEVANQTISIKQVSTSNIAAEFPTVPEFTNAVHYIDINLDVQNIEAELTFEYDEATVTGFGLDEDSLAVSTYDSLDSRGFIWHLLPSTVDTDNNTITVTTNHFSLWAIASSTEELITTVDDEKSVPRQFALNPNYPNPFNPATTITYDLDRTGIVVLKIYDVLGREVRTLVNTQQVTGSHTVVWDGNNNAGIPVASGTYISRLQSENSIVSRRLTLIK